MFVLEWLVKEVVKMMKKLLKKYGGVIFFYVAIMMMVWVIDLRFNYLNKVENNNLAYVEATD